MEKRRIVVMIDGDAWEILERNTTERTKGAFLSDLLRGGQPKSEAGILERIERKLDQVIEAVK